METTTRKLTDDERLALIRINNRGYDAAAAGDTDEAFKAWADASEDGQELILQLTSEGVALRDIDLVLGFISHWTLSDGSVRCDTCYEELGEAYTERYAHRIQRTSKPCEDCGHDNQLLERIEEPS